MVLMTEQEDRPLTPLSAPEKLSNRDSRGNRSTSEVDHGAEWRPRRHGGSPTDLQLCLDTETDPSESRKKPASVRLKPVEQLSPVLNPSDCETKFERKKAQPSHLSKTNAQYHKLFKEVSKDELLKQSYTCALQRDILYQGKMFVSDNWVCFHSKVFGRDTKSICGHLEVDKTGSSPVISSCENSFRVKCPSSLPLHFSADFSALDGVVQQRRQEMMESSSSGSQTPDYDKITDFSGLPDKLLSAVKSREVSVHADIHLQSPSQKHGAALKNGSTKLKDKSSQPMSLHAILLIYLFLVTVLVLSSCYMAFKIVALEHRLNSLVSVGQHIRNDNAVSHRPQEESNSEIYGELSSNLFKLEKIQRSLRKLLEET
ncbi:hypothetical protein PFLUV_G00204480 [Perca fluviatilis]|uniref:GRAM domain-containing protein n=1 Tax=Perca fluviatilis TaxID=8168 RepID=A0A6A5EFZ6_PERFL|nr:hypothetical protein PFLUV_G00204480 [Perca fluviatilis]